MQFSINTISIILASLFISFIILIFKLFFINQYYIKKLIKGCSDHNCETPSCVRYNCKVEPCYGSECRGGTCIGENCKAGDCHGTNCKAGDCYGYNCKPGICHDPLCPLGKCLQLTKNCQDGKALRIDNTFYLKPRKYFPKGTIMNPPLCDPHITMKDILEGRTSELDLQEINYDVSYDNFQINLNKTVVESSVPELIKNINCEICKKENNHMTCQKASPLFNQNGKIEWK